MSGFIDYVATARQTDRALQRAGLALGIDWHDARVVQAIVRDALDRRQGLRREPAGLPHGPGRQRLTLCALVLLRRRLELELDAADAPISGTAWAALSRELDREIASRLGG